MIRPGERIGRIRITGEIAEGGMGARHCREGHGLTDAESRDLCRRHGL